MEAADLANAVDLFSMDSGAGGGSGAGAMLLREEPAPPKTRADFDAWVKFILKKTAPFEVHPPSLTLFSLPL